MQQHSKSIVKIHGRTWAATDHRCRATCGRCPLARIRAERQIAAPHGLGEARKPFASGGCKRRFRYGLGINDTRKSLHVIGIIK